MLKDEIIPYLDSNGLAEPEKGKPSNNGVMYTGEYIIMLIRNGECSLEDTRKYLNNMGKCMPIRGLLQRNPDNSGGQEGPDDYLGLAAGLHEIALTTTSVRLEMEAILMARSIVNYGFKHLGVMNNEHPGTFTKGAWLLRQPQLTAAFLWTADLPVGPLLRLYVCLTILLAGFRAPKSDTDSRRLSWLLLQVAKRHSFICRLAGKVWLKRLRKDYGDLEMKAVADMSYEPLHPFTKYWVT